MSSTVWALPPLLLLLLQLPRLVLVQAVGHADSHHCRHYGGCYPYAQQGPYPHGPRSSPYVPAPPGETPRCARPGATFCEAADHYPTNLVQHLIERWAFDLGSLLQSEADVDFSLRLPVSYGSPATTVNGAHSVPLTNGTWGLQSPQSLQSLQQAYQPAAVYGPPGPARGYPERRYQLDPTLTAITNAPPVSPNPAVSAGPAAWARYRRRAPSSSARPRRQAAFGSSTLCPTSSSFVAPQAALNTQGNWMFVANVPEPPAPTTTAAPTGRPRYKQFVRTETCVSSECDGLCSLPNGYTSRCEQQYVQKRLVALGGGGDRLYTDTFWFPHCCVCQITPTAPTAG